MLKELINKLFCRHEFGEWNRTDLAKTVLTDSWSSESGWNTYTKCKRYCDKCGKSQSRWIITMSAGYGGLKVTKHSIN